MNRLWLALALLGGLLLAGCQSRPKPPEDYVPLVARFFLEARPGETGAAVTLPVSGVTINVAPKPVFSEYDVANAEVAQVELGRCLLIQLTPSATRDLYRQSVGALGRRLVLSLNNTFVGARRIEAAMGDGVVLVFVELPDDQLPALVERLKRTSSDLAAKKSR